LERKKTSASSAVAILLVFILLFAFFHCYGYDWLLHEFNKLYRFLNPEAKVPPYSETSGGKIRWVFYDLKRNVRTWEMPLDTYRYYLSMTKPVERLGLSTVSGPIWTYDLRPYIQPSFFRSVIGSLTSQRSDREFVKEVDNIKNQIVVYGKGLGDAPFKFSAETLTEGRGTCADTTILMASMLIEGNRKGSFNIRVYAWYVQLVSGSLVSDSRSLTQANHVIVQVEFSNGEKWAIETTTNYFFIYKQPFTGWSFEVTAISK